MLLRNDACLRSSYQHLLLSIPGDRSRWYFIVLSFILLSLISLSLSLLPPRNVYMAVFLLISPYFLPMRSGGLSVLAVVNTYRRVALLHIGLLTCVTHRYQIFLRFLCLLLWLRSVANEDANV